MMSCGSATKEESGESYAFKEMPVQSDHLWKRYTLSLPDWYNLSDIEYTEGIAPIGWSLNGELFAYVYSSGSYMNWTNKVLIRDVINDKTIDELLLAEADPENEEGSLNYYDLKDNTVNRFLREHRIAQNVEYSKGSTYRSELLDKLYSFEVDADKHAFDIDHGPREIKIYARWHEPYTKRKRVTTIKTEFPLYGVYVAGIIKSPIENRAILLTVIEERGFEGEIDPMVELFGCRLNDDDFF